MNTNVFFYSDASYNANTRNAGLGIIDNHTGKEYKFHVQNVASTTEAEMYALIKSVKIALSLNYKHVVFVYDCQPLNTVMVKNYLDTVKQNSNIKSYQFLWLKREFLSSVDKISKEAAKEITLQNRDPKIEERLSNYMHFKKYESKKIIKAFLMVAHNNAKLFLEQYMRNDYLKEQIRLDERDLLLLKDLYHFLDEENKERMFSEIKSNVKKSSKLKSFRNNLKRSHYCDVVARVALRLKSIRDEREMKSA